MAVNRLDATKPAEEVRNGDKTSAAAPVPAAPSGMKAWIPLMVNILLMPVIAYGVTTFVLIPKLQGGKTEAVAVTPEAPAGGGEHGAAEANSGKTGVRGKVSAPLGGKVLVNVAGTAGTRYLVANITLVGKRADLKAMVDTNDAELRDAASSILSGKTITDLEKPGMRNIIRAELISAFNDILGKDTVNEIYLTEFAVQ
jgi:flagellar FliL protein